MPEGYVKTENNNGIAVIEFFHHKKNSLPANLLKKLAEAIRSAGEDDTARVIMLRSGGDGPFCAGASFEELLAIKNFEHGKEFFMGFARVILAMKNCSKFIIARVQGKAVGGGVGLIAAADYALAVESAAVKLSELAVGIGPFVIGPAVERRIGKSSFQTMSIDTEWRSADWAKTHGLYAEVFKNVEEMNESLQTLLNRLSESNPAAMAKLKTVFTQGTENWKEILEKRAEMSGRLVLSEFTRKYIQSFKK